MSKSSKRGLQSSDSDKSGSSSKGSEDSFERDLALKPKNQSKKVKKIDDAIASKPEPEKKLRERRPDAFDQQLKKAMELSLLEAPATTSKSEAPPPDSIVKKLEQPKTTLKNDSITVVSAELSKSNSVSSVKSSENKEKPSELENKETERERESLSSSKTPNAANEQQEEPIVIDLDNQSGNESDDFIGKKKTKKKVTPPKSKKTLDEKEKKASASKKKVDKNLNEEDGDEIVDDKKNKAKKKKTLKLSDSEEEDEFKPKPTKSNDEEEDEYKEDDDEDFSAKKKAKKTTTKKKTSPDDKEKKPTKKKTDKENVPEVEVASSNKELNQISNEEEKSFVVTPFVSKTIKHINSTTTTTNSTSTPNVDSINPKSTSKLDNKPVNKFLANTSLLNTSASSSPLGRIEIKTPSFARVGLSRNFKVKPLHPNAKPV